MQYSKEAIAVPENTRLDNLHITGVYSNVGLVGRLMPLSETFGDIPE